MKAWKHGWMDGKMRERMDGWKNEEGDGWMLVIACSPVVSKPGSKP